MVFATVKSHQKILVCAPSNAAVDEIITRVSKNGLTGTKYVK